MLIIIGLSCLMLALLLILLAAFPVGLFKDSVEQQLASRFGAKARITGLEREELLSFSPVIRITGLRIPQPQWAGTGDLATVRTLRARVHVLPMLIGRTRIALLNASGIRLDLVRAADRRMNWRTSDEEGSAGGGKVDLGALAVDDAMIRYRDAVQNRSFTLALQSDPMRGLTASGTGKVDGAPVTLRLTGGAMNPDRPWPFTARIEGTALSMAASGTMAGPLRTDAMAFHITARADDLKRVDRIIEAGLFRTQPVALSGDVRRENDAWIVKTLTGTIGRSAISGDITARKMSGRVKLDGRVHFTHLDFDDLASDEGKAKAIALEQAQGLRLVPDTRINIRKIDKTDGRIDVRVDKILDGRRPSVLTDIQATLHLDDRILTIASLRIGLTRGAITGKAVVNQRDGRPDPRVTLALDMTGSSIATVAGGEGATIDGRMDGRVRLTGMGSTLREAVGHSNGTIGIAARDGTLPAKIAALIGFDVGRGFLAGDKGMATLRCAIVRLDMHDGTGTFAPLLIDTSSSQTRGTGAISFPNETIAATLTGAPKRDALLVVPGYIMARGTIREPQIVVPEATKSVGNVLKAIGRAITGHDEPLAADADCATLSRRAIGR